MALGLTRPRSRLGGAISGPLDRSRPTYDGHRHWHAERGEILFEAACDVVGGFPGYAVCGGHLAGHRLRVTERYLLVGDGDEFGFGLAIRDIDGVALVPLPDGDECGLRLFYQDGTSPRLFTVRFCGNRLSMRSGPRAERAHISLLRAGLVDRFGISPPPEPDFIASWDETAGFDAENVIWTGRATIPRHVGLEGVPGSVWLTTRSLIWGCETVTGVHRLPLAVLTDVAAATVADRTATPAVHVGFGDELTGHFDLAFRFDQQATADHNLRDRGAMLVGLRSRGLPIGSPTPPFQPWRHAAHPVSEDADAYPEPDEDDPRNTFLGEERSVRRSPSRRRLGTFDLTDGDPPYPARPDHAARWPVGPAVEPSSTVWADADTGEREGGPTEPSPRLLDVVLAEWSGLPDDRERSPDDVQVAASWLSPLTPTEAEPVDQEPTQDGARGPIDEAGPALLPATSADEPSADANGTDLTLDEFSARDAEKSTCQTEGLHGSLCWPRAAAYESAAVGVLAEILTAIRDRVGGRVTPVAAALPTAAEQSAALAELAAACQAGLVAPDELRARSARILALGDACVRLRTLLELRDAGHVSDADLARRQQSITAQLAAVMEVR
jgi:hypothetical protein